MWVAIHSSDKSIDLCHLPSLLLREDTFGFETQELLSRIPVKLPSHEQFL